MRPIETYEVKATIRMKAIRTDAIHESVHNVVTRKVQEAADYFRDFYMVEEPEISITKTSS